MKYTQRVLEAKRKLAVRFELEQKVASTELDAMACDALARELALQSTLVDDGGHTVVQIGRDFVQLTPDTAKQIARHLIAGKLRLEELAQAERIARDSGILLRAGSNFALSNDNRIIEAAKAQAAWGDFRRYMPGGVKSAEAFGLPAVIQHPPRSRT